MSALKKNPASVRVNGAAYTTSSAPRLSPTTQISLEKVRELVAELEVPFHPSLIEWQVMNTSDEGTRGKIAPYADPRAYTDRLNQLFTPAGWTRKYTVTTSANFERSEDKKLVAKVFVTCDLTIHGIGSHSATGEEWADDDNAGTSAEAQAFKRACSCFGLGRYLYYFSGIWIDLDERRRPKDAPQLFGWATPQGWRQGLRPEEREDSQSPAVIAHHRQNNRRTHRQPRNISPKEKEMIQQIEAMAELLGKPLYRGLLKNIARVWKPGEIREIVLLEKVLTSMQSAERGLGRLEAVREKIGSEELKQILRSLKLKSIERVENLETLHQLVLALEEKVGQTEAL